MFCLEKKLNKFQVDFLSNQVLQMLGELRESQSTPVQEKKGKGKEREVVEFSDIKELDGPPSSKGSEPKPR